MEGKDGDQWEVPLVFHGEDLMQYVQRSKDVVEGMSPRELIDIFHNKHPVGAATYRSCDKDTRKSLFSEIKAALKAQGVSVHQECTWTEKNKELRVRCAHRKKAGCNFMFSLFWDAQQQHWYIKRGPGIRFHKCQRGTVSSHASNTPIPAPRNQPVPSTGRKREFRLETACPVDETGVMLARGSPGACGQNQYGKNDPRPREQCEGPREGVHPDTVGPLPRQVTIDHNDPSWGRVIGHSATQQLPLMTHPHPVAPAFLRCPQSVQTTPLLQDDGLGGNGTTAKATFGGDINLDTPALTLDDVDDIGNSGAESTLFDPLMGTPGETNSDCQYSDEYVDNLLVASIASSIASDDHMSLDAASFGSNGEMSETEDPYAFAGLYPEDLDLDLEECEGRGFEECNALFVQDSNSEAYSDARGSRNRNDALSYLNPEAGSRQEVDPQSALHSRRLGDDGHRGRLGGFLFHQRFTSRQSNEFSRVANEPIDNLERAARVPQHSRSHGDDGHRGRPGGFPFHQRFTSRLSNEFSRVPNEPIDILERAARVPQQPIRSRVWCCCMFGNGNGVSMDQRSGPEDQNAGVHRQPAQTRSWLGGLFGGTSNQTTENTLSVNVENFSSKTNRRRTPLFAALCNFLRCRRTLLATFIGVGAFMMALACVCVVFWSTANSEHALRASNTERFNEILDTIVQHGVSSSDSFLTPSSPELHALKWIAYSDPNRLSPDDPIILQRYALATFFYSSYLTFTRSAGKQKPIEFEGQQYEGVPNAGWVRQDYWLSEKGICSWFGVTCVERVDSDDGLAYGHYDANGHVIALNLTDNHVYGPVPSVLKGLHTMVRLDLSHNRMRGTFPSSLGHMLALEELFLQNNFLTGTLPATIGLLYDVRSLNLGHNRFRGTVPTELNRWHPLERLVLENNQFTGTVPDFGRLEHLEVLLLNNNQFKSPFPFTLVKSTKLVELRLHQNLLSGTIPPELESMRKLKYLQVNDNRLTGVLPTHAFLRLTDLREFQGQRNGFVGNVPSSLGTLSTLKILHLSNNQLTGCLTDNWHNSTSMETLHLYENDLGGMLPSSIGNMMRLRELWVNDNSFSGAVPASLGRLENLSTLYLENNKFSGTLPTELGSNMLGLESLRLYDNGLTGTMPAAVCDLKAKLLSFVAADCLDGQPLQCSCCDKCY